MKRLLSVATLSALSASALGNVFINEIFVNPPGSLDDTREFIELNGTPGKNLDGYGIAVINGALTRFYPLGSIPPRPLAQEIDEFYSLDGLALGPNGMLVIGTGVATAYPTLLPDTNHRQASTLWNGFLDTVGNMNNDGSNTIVLIRNRPGATQATNPTLPASPNLRWGKDIACDDELVTPVEDPQTMTMVDQYGDGRIDRGLANGTGGFTLDLKGATTPGIEDDLEIVDEVSYEQDRGWEYDFDGRTVDAGSTIVGLPPRNVHALDDVQGFHPDALTRVDYRTSGPGWVPASGATGELPNGNNWQDTATEQWIRGESLTGTGGQGAAPQFYFSNVANVNPDAIQPFETQVPLWLNDGTAPDFNFAVASSYQIMAGRTNLFATPYIPGDVDRDGDADLADIGRIAAVFGDDDWIFSNSFTEAPEGDSGDPATQTRPWDVDQTGDNGVDPSDLQWTLNFLGNSSGRIVGRTYDSATPSGVGVHLNPSAPVACTITATSTSNLQALSVGDSATIRVTARVTSGANPAAGQENGVMQFVNDVEIAGGGVIRVVSVAPATPFSVTRGSIQTLQGTNGDRGISAVNGYTTDFARGVASASELYMVTIRATGEGSTTLAIRAAQAPNFANGTPGGLKVGHTNNNGNPAAVSYPALQITVGPGGSLIGDMNCDGFVTVGDIGGFVLALTNPTQYASSFPDCELTNADVNGDTFVTVGDIGPFVQLLAGG